MEKSLSEDFVKDSIVAWLKKHDWNRNLKIRELRDKGVDIKVQHTTHQKYFLIEAKGEGKHSQANDNNFVYSLGQIVTRMKYGSKTNYKYAIGLPDSIAKIAIRRLPWQIMKKLSLTILSVDKFGEVSLHTYKDIKK